MNSSYKNLIEEIIQFRDERDWSQFHKIKDLLIGLNIEVSELEELFLWKNDQEINSIEKSKVEDEIADIFIFLTYISHHFNIDLLSAVKNKLKKNSIKYPVESSKGSNKKYNQLNNQA